MPLHKAVLTTGQIILLEENSFSSGGEGSIFNVLDGSGTSFETGKYVAKIFRRFGIDQGSTTAIGKIKFTSDSELTVTVKSGGLGIGYFFLFWLISFAAFGLWGLLQPALVEELELNLFASVIAIPIFGFMSWIFLSRYMRESDLELMESYLKDKLGGEWNEE